jgi:PEP-CTERM motif-containing protein
MKRAKLLCSVIAAAVLPVVGLSTIARGSVITTDLITIKVTGADGNGSWHLPTAGNYTPGQNFSWHNTSPIVVTNGSGTTLVTVPANGLSLSIVDDPQIALNFAVTAGNSAQNFTIGSGLLSFAPITNPSAVASAAATLTDSDGDGASVIGNETGTKLYKAFYNGSTTFALLDNSMTATSFASNSGNERQPLVGRQPIVGSVSNIGAEFSFLLSAHDQASGTSIFDVPEPSTAGLIGLAVLGIARRRK